MKHIISRHTGAYLSISEARSLCGKLKCAGVTCIEHRSVSGYPTPQLAEKANLLAVMEAHEGYTFAYAGTENRGLEGYKVLVIGIKELPPRFEEKYSDYVVIGR